MSKIKTKNIKQQIKKSNKLNYKLEYEKLYKQFNNLQNENVLLRTFNQPTLKQKIDILEEYYDWVSEKDYDANHTQTFFEYKKQLKKQIRS